MAIFRPGVSLFYPLWLVFGFARLRRPAQRRWRDVYLACVTCKGRFLIKEHERSVGAAERSTCLASSFCRLSNVLKGAEKVLGKKNMAA